MSILENKFGQSGRKGHFGEVALYSLLKSKYSEVVDHRQNLSVQSDGVDFSVKQDNWRKFITLDCKNNLFVSDNYYSLKIELESNGQPGWFFTSKADRIYHTSTYTKQYVYYDLSVARYMITKALLTGVKFNPIQYQNDLLIQIKWSDKMPPGINGPFKFN